MRLVLISMFVLCSAVLAIPARAQQAPNAPAPNAPPPMIGKAPVLPTDPAARKVMELAKALAAELNDVQVNALAGIRVNFGMMRAVSLAEKDVSGALANCGQVNPDLQPKLKARDRAWHAKLDPLQTSQNENLRLAVQSGVAGDSKKVQTYLDALDQEAANSDAQILKKPVTTPAACKALLKSMERTEPTLVNSLSALRWPPLSAATMPAPKAARP